MVFAIIFFIIFMMELDKQIQVVNWTWSVSININTNVVFKSEWSCSAITRLPLKVTWVHLDLNAQVPFERKKSYKIVLTIALFLSLSFKRTQTLKESHATPMVHIPYHILQMSKVKNKPYNPLKTIVNTHRNGTGILKNPFTYLH